MKFEGMLTLDMMYDGWEFYGHYSVTRTTYGIREFHTHDPNVYRGKWKGKIKDKSSSDTIKHILSL